MEKMTHLPYPFKAVYLEQVMLMMQKSHSGKYTAIKALSRNWILPDSFSCCLQIQFYLIIQLNFLYL